MNELVPSRDENGQFREGVSGNPTGRPAHRFGTAFLRSVERVWLKRGVRALIRLSDESPKDFIKICLSLVPDAVINGDGGDVIEASYIEVTREIRRAPPEA